MAALAQTHEVALIMGATFADGKNVVNLFHRNILSLHKAALTEWVFMNVAVADPFPCAAVGTVHIGITLVLIVLLPG